MDGQEYGSFYQSKAVYMGKGYCWWWRRSLGEWVELLFWRPLWHQPFLFNDCCTQTSREPECSMAQDILRSSSAHSSCIGFSRMGRLSNMEGLALIESDGGIGEVFHDDVEVVEPLGGLDIDLAPDEVPREVEDPDSNEGF